MTAPELFLLELHVFACVTLPSEANLQQTLHSDIFLLLVRQVVNVVILAVCIHEFGGGMVVEGTPQGGLAVQSFTPFLTVVLSITFMDHGSCSQVCFIQYI